MKFKPGDKVTITADIRPELRGSKIEHCEGHTATYTGSLPYMLVARVDGFMRMFRWEERFRYGAVVSLEIEGAPRLVRKIADKALLPDSGDYCWILYGKVFQLEDGSLIFEQECEYQVK